MHPRVMVAKHETQQEGLFGGGVLDTGIIAVYWTVSLHCMSECFQP